MTTDMIELDLKFSLDNRYVVLHDRIINRRDQDELEFARNVCRADIIKTEGKIKP